MPAMKSKAILWLKAARLRFHLLAILPVLMGSLIAYSKTGNFSILSFVISEIIAVSVLIAVIFSNDYADHDLDKENHLYSILAGHTRANVEGRISKHAMLFAAVLASIVAIAIPFVFVIFFRIQPSVIILSIVGLLAGIEYSYKPLQIGHRPLGEALIIIMYSLFSIFFGFAAQAGPYFMPEIVYYAIPVGIGIFLIILTAEISDYNHDKKCGKKTLPTVFGKEKTLSIYFWGLILLYASIIALYFASVISKFSLTWILMSLPVAVYAGAHAVHKHKTLPKDALNVCGVTIVLYIWVNIMLALNLVR
jgi:1,4-dihydroxy-2-naphthoate polyprenyltransferase